MPVHRNSLKALSNVSIFIGYSKWDQIYQILCGIDPLQRNLKIIFYTTIRQGAKYFNMGVVLYQIVQKLQLIVYPVCLFVYWCVAFFVLFFSQFSNQSDWSKNESFIIQFPIH